MPQTKSVKKSLRQSIKKNKKNRLLKSRFKKASKEFLAQPNLKNLKKVYSSLDKIAKKKLFHKNKVSRLKSKYAKKVKPTNTVAKGKTTKANKV